MPKIIFACVRSGSRYPLHYVERLRDMIRRNCPVPFQMICITDQSETCPGVQFIDMRETKLERWWLKMALFARNWRREARVIYLDLDTVIVGDLMPLVMVNTDFAICANFTRAAGNANWPCAYGSCVMVLGETLGDTIWRVFEASRAKMMHTYDRYGDQRVIEAIWPGAVLLQNVCPPGYFISYRAVKMAAPPPGAAIVNFGGRNKPDNCEAPWVRSAWMGA